MSDEYQYIIYQPLGIERRRWEGEDEEEREGLIGLFNRTASGCAINSSCYYYYNNNKHQFDY